jgi:hypothetical protein
MSPMVQELRKEGMLTPGNRMFLAKLRLPGLAQS